MSNIIRVGVDPAADDPVIILPDGTVHTVEQPDPEPPTRWEILREEVHAAGPALEQMRRAEKHIVHATLVEALALRSMGQRS